MSNLVMQKSVTDKKELAICIPTYNNAEYIKDILVEELPYYERNNMRLYIMDSSENDETHEIVQEYKENFGNLYYYRFPSDLHSNKKVYMTFQMAGKEIPCDYMWIRSDATRANRKLLDALPIYMDKGYDFIETNYYGEIVFSGIWEVVDIQSYFEEYAWKTGTYGDMIVRTGTVILGTNWEYLEGKYFEGGKIGFSNIAFYFERIAELDAPRILVMDLSWDLYFPTPKKKYSMWYYDALKIILVDWPETIYAFPDIYKNKLYAIRTLNRETGYWNKKSLQTMAEKKILTPQIYEELLDNIIQYSMVNPICFYQAAHGLPIDDISDGIYDNILNTRLKEFSKRYTRIVIYGAGKIADRYVDNLNRLGISFEGFVVTSSEDERLWEKHQHPVMTADDFDFNDCGIILGLGKKNQREVYSLLERKNLLGRVLMMRHSWIYQKMVNETILCRALTKDMRAWT